MRDCQRTVITRHAQDIQAWVPDFANMTTIYGWNGSFQRPPFEIGNENSLTRELGGYFDDIREFGRVLYQCEQ